MPYVPTKGVESKVKPTAMLRGASHEASGYYIAAPASGSANKLRV